MTQIETPKKLLILPILVVFACGAHAAIPLMINHQGFVRVDGKPFAGTGEFKFGLYDADTALWVWTNDPDLQSGAFSIPPNAFLSLSVSDGHYSVILGDTNVAGMAAISSSAFDSDQVRLRIWFNDGTNGLELLGDERITSGAYAFHAATADRADSAAIADAVVVGAVTSSMIANGAIDAADFSAGAVSSAAIANGTISSVDMADGAVTTAKLADSSITTSKFGAGAVAPHASTSDNAGQADSATIADGVVSGAVTSDMIANGTIGSSDIAAGAVTSAAIANGAINSVDIATGAVTTNGLANSAITTEKFDAGAVAPHAVTADSVTIAEGVVAGAVTSSMIANGTIAAGDIAAGAVTTSKLADSSITTDKFDPNAIAPHAAQADSADGLVGTPNYAQATGSSGNVKSDLFVDVPGLLIPSFSTSGLPVFVNLTSGSWYANDESTGELQIVRLTDGDTTVVLKVTMQNNGYDRTYDGTQTRMPIAFSAIDIAPPGMHSYKVQVRRANTPDNDDAISVQSSRLEVLEIGGVAP